MPSHRILFDGGPEASFAGLDSIRAFEGLVNAELETTVSNTILVRCSHKQRGRISGVRTAATAAEKSWRERRRLPCPHEADNH